jgi:hypothetical protein
MRCQYFAPYERKSIAVEKNKQIEYILRAQKHAKKLFAKENSTNDLLEAMIICTAGQLFEHVWEMETEISMTELCTIIGAIQKLLGSSQHIAEMRENSAANRCSELSHGLSPEDLRHIEEQLRLL